MLEFSSLSISFFNFNWVIVKLSDGVSIFVSGKSNKLVDWSFSDFSLILGVIITLNQLFEWLSVDDNSPKRDSLLFFDVKFFGRFWDNVVRNLFVGLQKLFLIISRDNSDDCREVGSVNEILGLDDFWGQDIAQISDEKVSFSFLEGSEVVFGVVECTSFGSDFLIENILSLSERVKDILWGLSNELVLIPDKCSDILINRDLSFFGIDSENDFFSGFNIFDLSLDFLQKTFENIFLFDQLLRNEHK